MRASRYGHGRLGAPHCRSPRGPSALPQGRGDRQVARRRRSTAWLCPGQAETEAKVLPAGIWSRSLARWAAEAQPAPAPPPCAPQGLSPSSRHRFQAVTSLFLPSGPPRLSWNAWRTRIARKDPARLRSVPYVAAAWFGCVPCPRPPWERPQSPLPFHPISILPFPPLPSPHGVSADVGSAGPRMIVLLVCR